MQINGQIFTSEMMERIADTVERDPGISRRALSRRVCEWMDWRGPSGCLQEMSCRKALLTLNRRGVVHLPVSGQQYGFQRQRRRVEQIAPVVVKGELADLGEVIVDPVGSRYSAAAQAWKRMLETHHPLGSGPLCGAQQRYIVHSSRHGYLGALGFSAASWALRDRDGYIGWSEGARRAHLREVVCNSRFLILPGVEVANLASHVLALATRRLVTDWQGRYGVSPVLVESFVGKRYRGSCYRAANWQEVGASSGRRGGGRKRILVYALQKDWRQVLCAEPCWQPDRPLAPRHWAEEEFGTVRLYDRRLKERLYQVAMDFSGQPTANIPAACGTAAKTKGAYRFFKNRKIDLKLLLQAHREASVERIKGQRVVLAPQDTTTLNYSTHGTTTGLGPINNSEDTAVGLLLHDTLAFSEDGTPLGVVDAQCWARDPADTGKKYRRHELPIEQKESMKWLRSFRAVAEIQKCCPDTMMVSIGDREADLYELFAEAYRDPAGPKLLVRAERTRSRKVATGDGHQELLWSHLQAQQPAGELGIHISRRGNRAARDADVTVRLAPVALKPPAATRGQTLRVWAVYVCEHHPPADIDQPLEWMLLTTVLSEDFKAAQRCVDWYAARWGIEVYHRTLKSGCRIQDRRLADAGRLEACLALDMVVAWRIYHLTMLGREHPEHPCTVFFTDIEWKALWIFVRRNADFPPTPPPLNQIMRMAAGLGGFLGRKGDGHPGTQTLWRGLQRLDDIAATCAALCQLPFHSRFTLGP